ncbi:hypothetical protein HYU23_02585 [Candidatus Woesearchaeota archaeon]|nr:hypothetical protein [Candidatus Woesearchaeota archaeon]
MQKKGDVWVSAILYFGLGIVVISILLAAGLPVINKLRDKNVVIQTKQVMHNLDQSIREVVKEGPGSQRVVTVNIKKGSFIIDEKKELVIWQYNNSKVLISEIGIPVFEGKLTIITREAQIKNNYNIQVYTNYSDIANITRPPAKPNTLVGINDMVIRNDGVGADNIIQVTIYEANK